MKKSVNTLFVLLASMSFWVFGAQANTMLTDITIHDCPNTTSPSTPTQAEMAQPSIGMLLQLLQFVQFVREYLSIPLNPVNN